MAGPALETLIQPPQELRLQGLEAPGRGRCSAQLGQERPCCPGPSRPLPVPGEAGSWAVSRRPVLRSLRCWIRAPGLRNPLRGAAARAPPSCSGSRCALQPLGSSAHSPGRAVALLLSQGARGHPRPPGSCSNSPRAPFPREGRCSSCVSGTGLSCPGDTRPGLSPAPRGAPPPWRPLFLYFFFPVFLP